MIDQPQTLYKLIVLYMLRRVDFPLTRSQIGDFILEKEYTDFLTLQQIFAQLIESNMIVATTFRNRTQLTITPEGEETLSYFKSKISPEIIEEINTYLSEKKFALENEISVTGRYQKDLHGEYRVELSAKEKEQEIMTITLSVPAESMAESICNNWQNKNQDIYKFVTEQLF